MTRVVIVGRDAPLWLALLVLRRALAPAGIAVEAVALPDEDGPADVYATFPAVEALHARIGLDEPTLLRATGGVFSLGTNMAEPGTAPFLVPWGSHGVPVEGMPFFPVWLRTRAQGLGVGLQDFSLTAAAATRGRLMLGDETTESFARTDYGYSLPARAYADVLARLAAASGATIHRSGTIVVEHDDAGAIAGGRLDDGTRIAGDLFVDASGAAAVLRDGLGGAEESWRDRFPADRRLVARAPGLRAIPPYLEQRASGAAWLRLQPVRGATHVVAAYRAADERVAREEIAATAGLPLTDICITSWAPGRRSEPWRANCVALGAAACTLDPMLGVELHAVQLGLVHLLALLPAGNNDGAERAEYNRLLISHLDRLADAQQAVYALAPWSGPLWQHGRAAAVEPTLAHRVATFRARGEIAPLEDDSLDETVWQALLIGLGVAPESWSPVADTLAPDAIKAAYRAMFGFIRDTVLSQPSHDSYLAEIAVGRA